MEIVGVTDPNANYRALLSSIYDTHRGGGNGDTKTGYLVLYNHKLKGKR
jgi:hypothetical protein